MRLILLMTMMMWAGSAMAQNVTVLQWPAVPGGEPAAWAVTTNTIQDGGFLIDSPSPLTEFPHSWGSWVGTANSVSASTFDFTSSRLYIDLDHRRSYIGQAFSSSEAEPFIFTVDVDVHYLFFGEYVTFDVSSGPPRAVALTAELNEIDLVTLELQAPLFHSEQISRVTQHEAFVLSGTGGDSVSILTGSSMGIIPANTPHVLYLSAYLSKVGEPIVGTDQGTMAYGDIEVLLIPVPEPSRAAGLAAGVLFLGALVRSRPRC